MKKWSDFCQLFQKEFYNPSEADLLHFLEENRIRGASYSALNTLRSAVSLISTNKIGDHPLITRYFKGAYKLNPPTPRYSEIWDVSTVLRFLKTQILENLSLQELSGKLATLLALITAHRCQTIHAISIDNLARSEGGIWITIEKPIKTSRAGTSAPRLFLPKFEEQPELCAVRTLEAYLEKTNILRGNTKALFITTVKPHGPASKDTVSRWITNVLSKSGVDTQKFTTHSTRHASTSAAKAAGVNIASIKATAGWSKESSVFARFYDVPIEKSNQEVFSNAILSKS